MDWVTTLHSVEKYSPVPYEESCKSDHLLPCFRSKYDLWQFEFKKKNSGWMTKHWDCTKHLKESALLSTPEIARPPILKMLE